MLPAQTVSVHTVQGNPNVIHVQQPPPTVVYAQSSPPTSNVRDNYADKASLALGIIQVCIGALVFILDIVGLAIVVFVRVGGGIWCGAVFIVAGIFGILASRNKNVNMIVAFMVMSIISAILSIIAMLSIYGTSAVVDLILRGDSSGHYALDCTMIALSLAECVVAIVSSAICCAGTCCYSTPGYTYATTRPQVIAQTTTTVPVGHMVQTAPQMQYAPQQPAMPANYVQAEQPPAYAPNPGYPGGYSPAGGYTASAPQPQAYDPAAYPQKM